MNERDNFALVPKPPGALEKAEPGAKHILSGMVADTLALVRKTKSQTLRIIVVDDDDDWVKLVEAMIQDWFKDAETVTFNSSQAALRELEQRDPDLLITGDKMPRMTGEELVHRLIAKNVNYPILVLTGHDEAQQWVHEYVSRGFKVRFQPKRGVEHELKRSIEEILNHQHGTIEKSIEFTPQPRIRRAPRIVVVDDDAQVRAFHKNALRTWVKDATIMEFENGDDAWRELLREAPDFLISDLVHVGNVGMNGFTMLRLLAEKKVKYPILIVSGNLPLMEAEARKCAGPHLNVTFWTKPFSTTQLTTYLRTQLDWNNTESHE